MLRVISLFCRNQICQGLFFSVDLEFVNQAFPWPKQQAEDSVEEKDGGEQMRQMPINWVSLSLVLSSHMTVDNLCTLSGLCLLILSSWIRSPFTGPFRGCSEFLRGSSWPRRSAQECFLYWSLNYGHSCVMLSCR